MTKTVTGLPDASDRDAELRRLLATGCLKTALDLTRNSLIQTPGDGSLMVNHVRLLQTMDQSFDRCWDGRLKAASPTSPNALELRATLNSETQEPMGWMRANLVAPDRPRPYLEMARMAVGGKATGPADIFSRQAIMCGNDYRDAYFLLSNALFPGPDYLEVLDFLDHCLSPNVYLEIGVKKGASFGISRARKIRIGVDPVPEIDFDLGEDSLIMSMTSDVFFDTRANDLFGEHGKPDLVFIDGLHSFAQTLTDFINTERHASTTTVVCLHDTLPLDENSSKSPESRNSVFWTGDSWRTIPCLRALRPDLRILNLRCGPSGLCVITGLDPNNTVLERRYGDALSRFKDFATPVGHANQERLLFSTELDWGKLRQFVHRSAQ